MDSLLANYASSDEEEEQQQQRQSTAPPPKSDIVSSSSSSKASSFFSSLPQPKSSFLFSSLPQPKQPPQQNPIAKTPIDKDKTSIDKHIDGEDENRSIKPTSNSNKSSIFSSLPQPKTQASQQPVSSERTAKRVVQFKPPSFASNNFVDEDDDEEDNEEKERKKRKQSENFGSVKSFLSSIPAPKSSATLGVLHSSSGSGRRSIIETEAPASKSSGFGAQDESVIEQNMVNYANYESGSDQHAVDFANYGAGTDQSQENYASYGTGNDQYVGNYMDYGSYQPGTDQNVHSSDASGYVDYGSYNGYGDYGPNDYGEYGQYGSGSVVPEKVGIAVGGARMPGKRGKNEIPTEIVEVKQDELIKDRPREDQVKLTGIAFGPSYQPVSTKGKPTKLHKRKHQIGSLFFDMKQKEMELAERRARGFLTKAQTQGKYGW